MFNLDKNLLDYFKEDLLKDFVDYRDTLDYYFKGSSNNAQTITFNLFFTIPYKVKRDYSNNNATIKYNIIRAYTTYNNNLPYKVKRDYKNNNKAIYYKVGANLQVAPKRFTFNNFTD